MSAPTFLEVGRDFIAGYGRTTRDHYAVEIRRFDTWMKAHDDVPLHKLRRVHIETYKQWLLDHEKLSPNTVSTYVGTVCKVTKYAYEEGIIPRDVGQSVRRGERPRMATGTWLTRDQLRTLLAVCRERAHPDVSAAVHILALNGLRIQELLRLRREDFMIVADRPCLHISRRKYSPGGQYVSLASTTMDVLQPLLDARSTGWLIRIPHRHPGGPRPSREDRSRRDAARFRLILQQFCEDEGLPRLTPHSLRHTFVTLSRDAGASDRDVMASTGHIDPRSLVYYDRAHASVERNATHVLAEYLEW